MSTLLNGMYAALLTGFDDAGNFCPTRQGNIIDYVAKQGLQGLYIGGSSGESGLMSTEELAEKQSVVHHHRQKISGNIIAHVGQPNLAESIKLAKQAEQLGFEALSALPPHSYPFSDNEIFNYYQELTSATNLPFIVYEIPFRTNRPLPTALLLRLFDLPNVQGIKFTSNDLYKFSELKRHRSDMTYFFGTDEIFIAAAALGCDGGIGTTYNVLGKLYVAANQAMKKQDLSTARALQEISQEYVEILLQTGVIPGSKLSLEILGYDVGIARKPMTLKLENSEALLSAFLNRDDVKKWIS
jgi:N-acetylneuraminate lyase